MASSINASTSGAGGVITTADNTGILNLQTAGTNAITVDTSQNVGIGTTSPSTYSTKFGVKTSADQDSLAYFGGSSYATRIGVNNSFAVIEGVDASTGTSSYQPFCVRGSQLLFNTGGTERMRIDSSGRVTMPYQPAFSVTDLTFPSGTSGVGTGGTVVSNVGSHYNSSNGRFTAPVSGTYLFGLSVQAFNSGSTTYVNVSVVLNAGSTYGSFVSGYGGVHNNHMQVTGSVILYLNANDYAQIFVNYGARSGAQSMFNGFLIG